MASARFVARRLGAAALVALGAATVVFGLLLVIPGDPVETILGEQALPLDKQRLRERLHLDDPAHVRYARFLGDLADGTMGHSYQSGRPVSALVAERLPYTVDLAVAALVVGLCIALPLGVAAALSRGRALGGAVSAFSLAGAALPTFWVGPMLVTALAVERGWFPLPGMARGLHALALPAFTLGLGLSAILSRMVRASLLETLREDWVTAARGRGLSEARVVWRHALRGALAPVVSVAGLQLGALLAGAVVTEKVFARPGLGTLMLEAIQKRDLPVVQGCVLVIAIGYVLVNLATDLVHAALDPRVRAS